MNVIIIRNDISLGNFGDIISVSNGFALSHLIPMSRVIIANSYNIDYFNKRSVELNVKNAEILRLAKIVVDELNSLKIILNVRASKNGILYGAITKCQLFKAIRDSGIVVKRNNISIQPNILKTLGNHLLEVKLQHVNMIANVFVSLSNII